MDGVVLATDPAPLPVKLVVACLAGLLPAVLSRRLRAHGKILSAYYLIACVIAAIAVHCVVFEDPGLIAGFVGLIIGVLVFVLASSRRASVFVASSVSLVALVTVGATVFIRMPPSEMRSAIARIRQCGGVVQQSDNPGTTYRDQWSVRFEHAPINDSQLLMLVPEFAALPKLWLVLSNCPVSDRGLAGLASADNLVWLQIDGTKVTDAALPHISNLTSLERLDLHGTRVSDEGVRSLLHLSNLRSVRLDGTAVTENGTRELRQALPTCTVTLTDSHGKRMTLGASVGAEPALPVSDKHPPRNKSLDRSGRSGRI
jgi:hypothetical protein